MSHAEKGSFPNKWAALEVLRNQPEWSLVDVEEDLEELLHRARHEKAAQNCKMLKLSKELLARVWSLDLIRGLTVCRALRHCLFASSEVNLHIRLGIQGTPNWDARSVSSLLSKFKHSRVSLWGLREHEFDDREVYRDPPQDEVIKGINKARRNGWTGLTEFSLRVTVAEATNSPGRPPSHVDEFLANLWLFPNLTGFELSNPADGNPFLPLDSVKALAASLEQCANLNFFRLSEYRFDTDHFISLSDSVVKCTGLTELHLVGCRIPAAEMAYLAKHLKDTCFPEQLTTLVLCDNGMDGSGICSWADVISKCSMLRRLELTCNTISSVTASAHLVRSLEACTAMTELRLESLGLEADHCQALSKACGQMSKLTCLDIGAFHTPKYDIDAHLQTAGHHNKLGAGAVDCLQLMQLQLLQTLFLSHVGLEAAGAKRLSSTLERLPKLECLDVSSNMILDTGLSYLVPQICHCTGLKELFLGNNGLLGRGLTALGEALLGCTKLECVDLADNFDLGCKSVKLVKCLRPLANSNLRVIGLGRTGLSFQSEEVLIIMTEDLIDFQFPSNHQVNLLSDEEDAATPTAQELVNNT